jgi:putative peptidoglycan lipid II flippase
MSESHSSHEQLPQASNSGESSLLKASGITGSMTLISRVLGLVRDVVIARVFGVSDGVEAFFIANKIPNFMRRLFAEGAFNQAFVPVLSEYRSTKSLADVQLLVNAVAGLWLRHR